MVCAVLREYGEPEKVAASYREPRYLIGPRLFPAFLTVLKIVLAVLGALALAGLVYTLTRLGTVPLETILREGIESLAKYLSAAVTVFGNVVLIFAILELVLPRVGRKSKAWDPRSLLGYTPADAIEPAGLAADIAFCAFAIVLFNFYPDWVGVSYKEGSGLVQSGTILTDAFFSLLPWLTIAWVAQDRGGCGPAGEGKLDARAALGVRRGAGLHDRCAGSHALRSAHHRPFEHQRDLGNVRSAGSALRRRHLLHGALHPAHHHRRNRLGYHQGTQAGVPPRSRYLWLSKNRTPRKGRFQFRSKTKAGARTRLTYLLPNL